MDLVAIVQKAFEAKKAQYDKKLDDLQDQAKFEGVVGNAVFVLTAVPLKGESDPLFTLYEPLPWEEIHAATLIAPDGARLNLDRNPEPAPGIKSFTATEVSVTGAECGVILEDGLLRGLDDRVAPASGEDQTIELLLSWAVMHIPDEKMAGFEDLAAGLQGLINETREAELREKASLAPAPAPAPRPATPPPAPV